MPIIEQKSKTTHGYHHLPIGFAELRPFYSSDFQSCQSEEGYNVYK